MVIEFWISFKVFEGTNVPIRGFGFWQLGKAQGDSQENPDHNLNPSVIQLLTN